VKQIVHLSFHKQRTKIINHKGHIYMPELALVA